MEMAEKSSERAERNIERAEKSIERAIRYIERTEWLNEKTESLLEIKEIALEKAEPCFETKEVFYLPILLNTPSCFIRASISSALRGASDERISGWPSVIRISSSMRTPMFHHLGSQSLPSGI